MEIRRIHKDGGSKAVAIPPAYLANLNLSIGDRVCIILTNDRTLIISKLELAKEGS